MPIKACKPCRHLENCKSQWGKKCREHSGHKIPKITKPVRAMLMDEQPETVASIYWMSGHIEHYTAADLRRSR